MEKTEVLIIGAGLAGLTLNYFLRDTGIQTVLIEARKRPGGRIQTLRNPGSPPIEMGATWLGRKHTHLVALLRDLGLEIFPQELGGRVIYEPISTSPWQLVTLPENDEPSYRIRGGTSALIDALLDYVDPSNLHLGQEAHSISLSGEGLLVECTDTTILAQKVVSTLPPHLFLRSIGVEPALPMELQQVMAMTHTWMGESIKFGITYPEPFWRQKGSSGTMFSNVGPVPEMYDHSSYEDDRYALKGFLNPAFSILSEEDRKARVLQQLEKYYGKTVYHFDAYVDKMWSTDKYTYASYEHQILPHQNNGHEIFRRGYLEDRLFIAGSETATYFPGYMDGAVVSAQWVHDQLIRLL